MMRIKISSSIAVAFLAVAMVRDFMFGSFGLYLVTDIHTVDNIVERDVVLGPFDVNQNGVQLDNDIVDAVEVYSSTYMGTVYGPSDSARVLSKVK